MNKNKVVVLLFLFSIVFNVNVLADPEDEGPLVYPVAGYDYAYDTIPLPATNIEATTATLNGWYGWGGNEDATVGFLYSDAFPIATENKTLSGSYNNESFSYGASSLNSSQCYFFTVWCLNVTFGWLRSYLNESFLTKPSGPPQNLTVDYMGSNYINLSWDNITDYQDTGVYQESIIRYSNTHYPNSPTDGSLGYQGTAETCSISGLDLDTQYYFSAWTHIQGNCSWDDSFCDIHQNSSEYSTITAYTQGGQYNLTIRYENRTYGPVNLTRWGPHRLIIYYFGQDLVSYYGEVDYVIFENNGSAYTEIEYVSNPAVNKTVILDYTPISIASVQIYNNSDDVQNWIEVNPTYWNYYSPTNQVNISSSAMDSNTTLARVIYPTMDTFTVTHDPMNYFDNNNTNFSQGKITFNINRTVKFFDFHWNDSTGRVNRCNRIVSPNLGQRDVDIFIRDDLPVYLESTTTLNHSLVKYTYSFSDETGKFNLKYNPRATIYTYDDKENKLIIHSQYLDDELHIFPWLVYEKTYFLGVDCDEFEYERIGTAPAYDSLNPEVRVPYSQNESYNFFDLISIDSGFYANGFYVRYYDTTYSTVNVSFKVYGMNNGTLIFSSYDNVNIKNYTVPCNTSKDYVWIINTTLDDVGDFYDGTYTSGYIAVFGGIEPVISNQTIDDIFETIFGPSPMYNTDTGVSVSYTYILIAIGCFLWLMTMGRLNAYIGSLGVGFILMGSGAFISGVGGRLFSDVAWWQGPLIVGIGVFVVALAIVGSLGGVEHRR